MSDSIFEPCDFCGIEEASNSRVDYDWTVRYEDGGPRATIPSVVLCYDCAEDVSDYFRELSRKTTETADGLAPFGEDDAEALLERLLKNEHLVLEIGRGSGYGIRAIDGQWKRAIVPLPRPPTIELLDRDEVKKMILDCKRLTLKHLDPSAWERFEDGQHWLS